MKKDVRFLMQPVLFVCVVFFATQAISAATFNVNSTLDTVDAVPGNGTCADASGNCTLRAAIQEANALAGADTINLPAGTYTQTLSGTTEDGNLRGDFDITSPISIIGDSSGSTFVQANVNPFVATERVFHITASAVTVSMSGITVRNGRVTGPANSTTRGGGIFNLAALTLTNVIVTNNQATGGGGIRNEGNLTLTNGNVNNNLCSSSTGNCFGGGMYSNVANAVINISNSSFNNNTSTTTFAGGSGFAAGAGFEPGASVTITNSAFSNNTGKGNGAGGSTGVGFRFLTSSGTSTLNVSNTLFNNNVGDGNFGEEHRGVGIGIFANPGTVAVNASFTNVTVSGNSGSERGGGVEIAGASANVTFNQSFITNNTAASGVENLGVSGGGIAIANSAVLTLNNTSVSGNNATATGNNSGSAGGIYNQGATVTLNNCSVLNNSASDSEGGISVSAFTTNATTTLNNTIVSGNTAPFGGGIVNSGGFSAITSTVNINNSTISGNSATSDGGGIINFNGFGSEISGIMNINFSTIANNTANSDNSPDGEGGGGIIAISGMVNVKNSIIADNTVGAGGVSPDCFGALTSGDFNLIEDANGCTVDGLSANNLTGIDPQLGGLALNGGSTMNHLPAASSPVIDSIPSGTNDCGTAPFDFDQRGIVRPFDTDFNSVGACERGAVEIGLIILNSNVLPNGTTGQPYNNPLTAFGGNGDLTFSIVSGTVPNGLTLQANGVWTGVPTASGTFNFTAQVQDSASFRSFAPNVAQKNFQIQILPPTAASVTISGRVLTSSGRAVSQAIVSITNMTGETRTARTNQFGYYFFEDIPVGETYIFGIQHKRYEFSPQVLSVIEEINDLNFMASP